MRHKNLRRVLTVAALVSSLGLLPLSAAQARPFSPRQHGEITVVQKVEAGFAEFFGRLSHLASKLRQMIDPSG